jgi:hypothetical protein
LEKSSQNSSLFKKCQNICIEAQFETLKHQQQATFEILKYFQQCSKTTYLGENGNKLLQQKVAQNFAIYLG